MSIYAMSDLHGESDLFFKTLNAIDFNYKKDKLYILGDVIDRKKGSVKILKHIIKNQHSIEMLLGNHEWHFLDMIEAYDFIMLNEDIKQRMIPLVKNRIMAFDKIESGVSYSLLKGNKKWYQFKKYLKWASVSTKRKLFFDYLQNFIEHINYDKAKYDKVNWVLNNIYGHYYTKFFVIELLEISKKDYIEIRDYLKTRINQINIEVDNKQFRLSHILSENGMYGHIFPKKITGQTTIFLFGHFPFGAMIRDLILNFKLNLNPILNLPIISYTDGNNLYYNLDTSGTNGIGLLCLNDLSKKYISKKEMISVEYNFYNENLSYSNPFKSTFYSSIYSDIDENSDYYIVFKNNNLQSIICLDNENKQAYHTKITSIKDYSIKKTKYATDIKNIINHLYDN